ncbi:MAG: hypothetical protein K1Y36_25975 [Blastocatellia bacterium]|nr:hypothetical protein [Blastocatellia bacterium]
MRIHTFPSFPMLAFAIFLAVLAFPAEGFAQVEDGAYAVVTLEGKNTYDLQIQGKTYPCYRHGRLTGGMVYYIDPDKGWKGGTPAAAKTAGYDMPAAGSTIYLVMNFDFGDGPGNKVFKGKVTGIGSKSFDTGKVFLDVEVDLGMFKYEGMAHHYATEAEYKELGWPTPYSVKKPDIDGAQSPNAAEEEKTAAAPEAKPGEEAKKHPPAEPGSGFRITFDYGKADQSFTPAVREQLEDAANFLAGFIADDREVTVTVVTNPAIKAFASAAPSEWEENTDAKAAPVAGGIAFNPKSISDVNDKQASIASLTIHELLHILGFIESAKAYARYSKGGMFTGPITVKMNNGKPVEAAGGHFSRSVVDPNGMSPRMADGGGDLLSILDLAVLADMGYTIPVLKGASGPVNLGFTLHPKQSLTMHYPDGSPAYLLQGYGGNDTLIGGDIPLKDGRKATFLFAGGGGDDILVGGAGENEMRGDNSPVASYGQDGKDTFVITPECGNTAILDLEDGKDIILLSPEFGISDLGEYLKDSKNFDTQKFPGTNFFNPQVYVLKLGKIELSITTRDKKKATAASFKIGEWKPAEK